MAELTFESRSRVIGSSDAIAIMGDDKAWLDLYRMKTDPEYHAKRRAEIQSSLMVMVGNTLEPLHLMLLGQKLGTVVHTLPGEERISHSEHSWLVDRPDGFVNDVKIDGIVRYGRSPVEVKACGSWQQAHERLERYWPQIQHHLLVTGGHGCVFSLLIGTTSQHYCYAERDPSFISHYLDRARTFVSKHLVARVPPVYASPQEAARYIVPAGLVPKVYDVADMAAEDRAGWEKLRSRYIGWQMEKDDLDAVSTALKTEATERFRKLVDPRQIKIGNWRCSLTKAGVVQWRDVSKSDEE